MAGHRINNTGRSTSSSKRNRRLEIDGPFIAMTNALLVSPSLAALNLAERRMLDRLCIEHLNHARTANGNLIYTYQDFEEFGVRRSSIARGLRVLAALGIIEIVEKGKRSWGAQHSPNRYRLTFVVGNMEPTNEWKRIKNKQQAESFAQAIRSRKSRGTKTCRSPGTKTGLHELPDLANSA